MGWKLRIVFLVGALAWYLNEPVPLGVSAPWQIRGQMVMDKISRTGCWLTEKLGVASHMECLDTLIQLIQTDTVVPDGITITDEVFNGVPVRIYKPKSAKQSPREPRSVPGLVYYHGGGWVLLDVKSYDLFMINIVTALDIVVVSVEYRLAPEYKFPVPLEDCIVATKYMFSNAKTYGVDPKRIAIGGDSAGGNLAAAVALKLRDEKFAPMPKSQMLIYPVLQGVDLSLPSYVQNTRVPVIDVPSMGLVLSLYGTGVDKYKEHIANNRHTTVEAVETFRSSYIDHEKIPAQYRQEPYEKPGKIADNVQIWTELKDVFTNPYFSPLLAYDLSDLPETYVYTAQYDVLRDEGMLYAQRLRDAGIKVTHVHGTTSFHGVCSMHQFQGQEEAKECVLGFIEYLKKSV